MKQLKDFLKKLVPGYLEIRSLYWVEHAEKMEKALARIHEELDEDRYEAAKELIREFEKEFTQQGVPEWVAHKYAEIYKANSMLISLHGDSAL